MNISVNDIKNGMTIMVDNAPCVIQDFSHVKPGKGAAFVKMKLKNLKTGSITEVSFNSGTKVDKAHITKSPMQYLYESGDNYVFMDTNTYEQVEINSSVLGSDKKYLKENLEILIDFYEGEIIGLTLPEKIEFVVTETEPAVKGNTANNAMKDATLETGLKVKVPLFIETGESIIVSTKDGKYSSRA